MKAFRALTCAFLLSSIAGCASTPPPATVTIYEQIYIPDSLLVGCPPVDWGGGTFRGVGELATRRKTALQDCDDKFTAARSYQDDLRAKAKAAAAKPGGR